MENANFLSFLQATDEANYMATGYSKASRSSRKIVSLTGGSFGFSKIGAGSVTFALGKKDGLYNADKSKFYEDLLDDARQTHVILQDAEDKRAWHTDAERVILHIILHRHALRPFKVDGKVANIWAAEAQVPNSVRHAMLKNADTIVVRGHHMESSVVTEKLFRDVVGELFTMIDGLHATSQRAVNAGIELKLDRRRRIQGWEYMDLVQRKLKPELRETELRRTCGQWPEFAHDIGAVILFGTGFREVFQPKEASHLCQAFRRVPKDKHYLAVEISALQTLYWENGSGKDQERLTSTGIRWQRSTHIFEPCPQAGGNKKGACKCERIQEFAPQRALGKVRKPGSLGDDGAVIFGKGNTSWINDVAEAWWSVRNSFQQQDDCHTPTSQVNMTTTAKSLHLEAGASGKSHYCCPIPQSPPPTSGLLSADNLEELHFQSMRSSIPKKKLEQLASFSSTETSQNSVGRMSSSTKTQSEYLTPATSKMADSGYEFPGAITKNNEIYQLPSTKDEPRKESYASIGAKSMEFERPRSSPTSDPVCTSSKYVGPSPVGPGSAKNLPATSDVYPGARTTREISAESKATSQACHLPYQAPSWIRHAGPRGNRMRGSSRGSYRQPNWNPRPNTFAPQHTGATSYYGPNNPILRRRPNFVRESNP
jgi:hypothetical protein